MRVMQRRGALSTSRLWSQRPAPVWLWLEHCQWGGVCALLAGPEAVRPEARVGVFHVHNVASTAVRVRWDLCRWPVLGQHEEIKACRGPVGAGKG